MLETQALDGDSFYFVNSVNKTKLYWYTTHRHSTTVSLETHPFLFICGKKRLHGSDQLAPAQIKKLMMMTMTTVMKEYTHYSQLSLWSDGDL